MKSRILITFLGIIGMAMRASAASSTEPVWDDYSTFQWEETRAQLTAGPAWLITQGKPATEVSAALRYRLSPRPWPESDERPWRLGSFPLSLFLEVGGIPPSNNLTLETQTSHTDPTITDQADLKFISQSHLALIDELPHGHQEWVIPELGAGIAMTAAKIAYATTFTFPPTPSGNQSFFDSGYLRKTMIGPYFSAGLHFFRSHVLSVNLMGSYFLLPDLNTLSFDSQTIVSSPPIDVPAHTDHFNFPKSAWTLQANLQLKWLWPSLVHRPLLPQLMPPWLLSAYTTEPHSPWVAVPEVSQKDGPPGRPPVGNVFFQYQNRWAKRVELMGDFNDWAPEAMVRDRSGIWVVVKDLPAGKFSYQYRIDGRKDIKDPWNKMTDSDGDRGPCSLVEIK